MSPDHTSRLTPDLRGLPGLRIRRARLRAPPGEVAAIRAALEGTDWPAAPGRAWVMVRGLSVSASRAGIGQQARERLEALLREAVPVGAAGSDTAGAVYCRDLADLLAALCTDLAAGRAAARWYWRSWSGLFGLPRGQALARLLGEAPESLTTVTEVLARRQGLATVWAVLEPADALTLLQGLAGWLGRSLPGPGAGGAAVSMGTPTPPARLALRWSTALRGLGRDDPRRWLAACLCALEWRPAALESPAAIAAVARSLDGDARSALARPEQAGPGPAHPARRETPPASGGGQGLGPAIGEGGRSVDPRHPAGASAPRAGMPVHAFTPGLDRDSMVSPGHGPWRPVIDAPAAGAPAGEGDTPATARPLGGLGSAADPIDGDGAMGEAPAPRRTRHDPNTPRPPAVLQGDNPAMPGPAEAPAPAGGEPAWSPSSPEGVSYHGDAGLPVAQGGLFYLINFLSRPEARALIAAHGERGRGSDGWALLWDLGRRLGLGPDPGLAAFFAERLDLGRDRSPWELPELDLGRDLHPLGLRLYGPGLFDSALLAVPARLHHTPSHLDIDLPLAAVRLAVRRVALDVDPGWVPWLGRVVTFHYRAAWDGPVPGPAP